MRHAIPAIYNVRQFPDVGGLISFSSRPNRCIMLH
jgi:hypothetical protein